MGRAPSVACQHCRGNSDSVEHTLFACPYWSGHREELSARLGHQPSAVNLPELLCGHNFNVLHLEPEEKGILLANTDEAFRLFYKMIKDILSLKETEERARQVAGRLSQSLDSDTRTVRVLETGGLQPG